MDPEIARIGRERWKKWNRNGDQRHDRKEAEVIVLLDADDDDAGNDVEVLGTAPAAAAATRSLPGADSLGNTRRRRHSSSSNKLEYGGEVEFSGHTAAVAGCESRMSIARTGGL